VELENSASASVPPCMTDPTFVPPRRVYSEARFFTMSFWSMKVVDVICFHEIIFY